MGASPARQVVVYPGIAVCPRHTRQAQQEHFTPVDCNGCWSPCMSLPITLWCPLSGMARAPGDTVQVHARLMVYIMLPSHTHGCPIDDMICVLLCPRPQGPYYGTCENLLLHSTMDQLKTSLFDCMRKLVVG